MYDRWRPSFRKIATDVAQLLARSVTPAGATVADAADASAGDAEARAATGERGKPVPLGDS